MLYQYTGGYTAMTYIVSLTPEQFFTLYAFLEDNIDGNDNILYSILHTMDDAKDHYAEREAVLRELLGIGATNQLV